MKKHFRQDALKLPSIVNKNSNDNDQSMDIEEVDPNKLPKLKNEEQFLALSQQQIYGYFIKFQDLPFESMSHPKFKEMLNQIGFAPKMSSQQIDTLFSKKTKVSWMDWFDFTRDQVTKRLMENQNEQDEHVMENTRISKMLTNTSNVQSNSFNDSPDRTFYDINDFNYLFPDKNL